MKRITILLRINFWSGAIIDAIMVPVLVLPKLCSLLMGLPNFNPDIMTQYLMNIGATLMASWTGILIWAAMKPVERKGIILITLFLVQLGLLISGIILYVQNGISLGKILPIWIGQGYLITLHIISYYASKNISLIEVGEADLTRKIIQDNCGKSKLKNYI
jgi:hypothetical protein